MNDGSITSVETTSPDEVTMEATGHPELNGILEHWIWVGALAWEGFLTRGPGYVLLTLDGHRLVHPSYEAGSPCACCPIDETTYDAETQAVIVSRCGDDQTTPLIVTGHPTPPEAFARADVDVTGGTVH